MAVCKNENKRCDDLGRNSPSERLNSCPNDSKIAFLDNVRNKKHKTIKDVIDLIGIIIEIEIKRDLKRERGGRINESVNMKGDVQERITHHHVMSEIRVDYEQNLDASVTSLQHQLDANESIINKNEQKLIDNDVFLTRFPARPKINEILKNVASLVNISQCDIQKAYTVNINSQLNNRKAYGVVVRLKDYATKKLVMTTWKKIGCISYSQLESNVSTVHANTTISCLNRLSSFNLWALKCFHQAKMKGCVQEFLLHNCFFRYKVSDECEWKIMSNSTSLKKIISLIT